MLRIVVAVLALAATPALAKQMWLYSPPGKDVGAILRYVSIDEKGTITGQVNGAYDEAASFYCEAKSGAVQLGVGFLSEKVLDKPKVKATLTVGGASLDVQGEAIPGNDEAPRFAGKFDGVALFERLSGARQLEIVVSPTKITLPLSTLGDKAATFAAACAKTQAGAPAGTSLVGRFVQIRSNAGECKTCFVTIAPAGDGLQITSNNGWSALLKGSATKLAGDGVWQTKGAWDGPIRVELETQGGELRLLLKSVRSGAALTAAYVREAR